MADLVKSGILLGMGNPLLDISATEVEYIAGGATQNSIRVAQWILAKKDATAFFGCVGRDDTSKTLEQKAQAAGVNLQYQFSEHPTGRCAVLITGQDRSLVTKLDAANHYNVSHLEEEANWNVVKAAQVVYSAGFFLTVSVDSMIKVAKHCAANNKTYCFNLSAPYLIQDFKEEMMSVIPFVDIIFGNETEAATYAEVHCPEVQDVTEIAKRIAMLPKENGSKSRLVVITQGSDPVIVVEDGKVLQFPVTSLPKDKIVDTNGAGDAFVGGFLAQFVQDKPLETAVRCGIWAATQIIQRSGCTHPEICDFDILQKANALDLSKLKIEVEETYTFPKEIKEESENLLSEYRRFLALKVISGDTSPPMMLSPSPLIDQVWHIHLLMPAHYLDCCRALGVDTIDHDPSSARDNEDTRRERLEMTKKKYNLIFKEIPPQMFWCLSTVPDDESSDDKSVKTC